jgi:hypothetical protein
MGHPQGAHLRCQVSTCSSPGAKHGLEGGQTAGATQCHAGTANLQQLVNSLGAVPKHSMCRIACHAVSHAADAITPVRVFQCVLIIVIVVSVCVCLCVCVCVCVCVCEALCICPSCHHGTECICLLEGQCTVPGTCEGPCLHTLPALQHPS